MNTHTLARFRASLEEFAQRPDNWDEEGALAPHPHALAEARRYLDHLQATPEVVYHIAPGPNGEIFLDLRISGKPKSVELYLHPEDAYYVCFEDKDPVDDGDLEIGSCPHLVNWLYT